MPVSRNLRLGRLLGIGRRRLVNGAATRSVERAGFIDWLADYIDDAAQRFVADRHRDRRSGVRDRLAAGETSDVSIAMVRTNSAKMLPTSEHEAIACCLFPARFQIFGRCRRIARRRRADDLGDAPRG